jgi:hypothetical protein
MIILLKKNQQSNHPASSFHMATVLRHDAWVPLDNRLTIPHSGHMAVTHGIIRCSIDSILVSRSPSPTSTEAYVS